MPSDVANLLHFGTLVPLSCWQRPTHELRNEFEEEFIADC